jgi:NADH-quinone oxidoreductase subunit C
MTHEQIESRLRETFPGATFDRQTGAAVRDFTLYVQTDRLVEICTFLRDDPALDFALLSWIGGVDLLPRDPRFEVVYSLLSLSTRLRLHLKVRVSDEQPRVPSVTSVWPTANFHEREEFDL